DASRRSVAPGDFKELCNGCQYKAGHLFRVQEFCRRLAERLRKLLNIEHQVSLKKPLVIEKNDAAAVGKNRTRAFIFKQVHDGVPKLDANPAVDECPQVAKLSPSFFTR